MEVSLAEAARLSGKSPRQIRYLIQKGRLAASKHDGDWRINADVLPRNAGQEKAQQARLDQARQAAEDVLNTSKPSGQRAFRSVRDLRAFEIGREIHRSLFQQLGSEHPAQGLLRDALERLACGCHEFQDIPRRAHFSSARELLARSVTALLLAVEPSVELADRIERELLPLLGALLRGLERRKRP